MSFNPLFSFLFFFTSAFLIHCFPSCTLQIHPILLIPCSHSSIICSPLLYFRSFLTALFILLLYPSACPRLFTFPFLLFPYIFLSLFLRFLYLLLWLPALPVFFNLSFFIITSPLHPFTHVLSVVIHFLA